MIIQKKIKRVVVGAMDPNPAHSGKAFKILRNKGVQLKVGVLKQECEFLNRDFNHWITHKTPWVTLKSAMSYDGRITRPPQESSWLTSEASQQKAHELRGESDAILIGGETLRKDNPLLTIRSAAFKGKIQPWRVVISQGGLLPKSSHLFKDLHRHRTLVYKNKELSFVLQDLGSRGVMNLLVEGGGKVHASFLSSGLANEVALFWAPMLTGTETLGFAFSKQMALKKSILLKPWSVEMRDHDLFLRALIQR